MKAVVAAPSVQDFYFTPRRDAALGARVLERELTEQGVAVSVHILSSAGRPRTVTLPSELEYLRRYLIPGETGPTAWFTAYRRFGPDPESAAELLLEENPDVIFVSCFAWGYSDDAIALARAVHRVRADIPIAVGGHGPSVLPGTFLDARGPESGGTLFRLVAAGEVEGQAAELMDALDSGDRFVDFRGPGRRNRSVRLSPICAAPSGRAGSRRVSVMLTRGCPCSCDFCGNHIAHGRQFRLSPPESWIPCLEQAVARWMPSDSSIHVNIEDDNILHASDQFYDFLDAVRSRFPGASFSAENGLDYRLMRTDDVDRLKESGFTEVNLSVGSVSTDSTRPGARDLDTVRLGALLRHAAAIGLPVTTHFICGSAGDSPANTAATLRYLGSLPTRIGISNYYPVPGLPGFKHAEVFAGQSPRRALGSSVYPWTGAMDTASMLTAFRLARWLNLRQQGMNGRKLSDAEDSLFQTITRTGRIHTIIRDGKRMQVTPVPNLNDELVRAVLS